MQSGFIRIAFFSGILSALTFVGCKTEYPESIDNDSVIKIPYSVYAASNEGEVIQSNDGENFTRRFPPDGVAPTQLCASGNNVFMVKTHLHMSTNNGKNFNPVFKTVRLAPWQNIVYNFPKQERVYVASFTGRGIFYSEDNGVTWLEDDWADGVPSLFEASSFAGIDNGNLFSYSNISNISFRKEGKTGVWTPVSSITFLPVDNSLYYISSTGNTLYLTDYNGIGGVWSSEDEGVSWVRFTQGDLTPAAKITATVSPYGGKTCVVSTEENGIFYINEHELFARATGLKSGSKVHSLSRKVNIYKDDTVKVYLFAATSTGLYRSEDGGKTWFGTTAENGFNNKYTAVY